MVQVLRGSFDNYAIRRDLTAVDDTGALISGLPPWYEVLIELRMSDREAADFERLIDSEVDEKLASGPVGPEHVSNVCISLMIRSSKRRL